ncbi:MAG: AsmA family protein [Endomicrobium sp.]|jgi:hypothetical protein|nr:AsmA family protein [Endomicrobium sp.]
MKKFFLITFVIIFISISLYLASFIILFNVNNLEKQTKHIINILTSKKTMVSGISLSPFGKLKIKNITIVEENKLISDFFISIDNFFAKISILNLVKADIIINDVHIDGLTLNLNYENKRKFNHFDLYENMKKNMWKYSKHGFIKNVKINSIVIEHGLINLKLDIGNIKFYDIVLQSSIFNYYSNYFSGYGSFKFKLGTIQSSCEFDFSYDKRIKTLYITNFMCSGLSLSAEGNIKFLDDGSTELEYTAKMKKEKLSEFVLNLIGYNVTSRDNYKDDMEDVIISYPNLKEKEIKTAI